MLEDEFVDVYGKAKRGMRRTDAELAAETGIDEEQLRLWIAGTAVPSEAQAHALARTLDLDPRKFADAAAVRFDPRVAPPPFVRTRVQRPQPSNGYVFRFGDDVAIVDPAGDPEAIFADVAAIGGAVRYVLVTHEHADHCDAAADAAFAYPQARFVVNAADRHALAGLSCEIVLARADETLPFGASEIAVLPTPGHTDGSTCFLFGDVLFTGDTLFAGSVGNVFARTATYADLRRNVRERLLVLDPETVVLPGHGPPTSIALERAHNPFF